jgi:hypothetical protein
MLEVLVYGYLTGWMLTTASVAFAMSWTRDRSVPRDTSLPLMIAVGAAWPVLVAGVVEYAGVVAAGYIVRDRGDALALKA